MQPHDLAAAAEEHLRVLCRRQDRSVGSDANREATRYFADRARQAGFAVATEDLPCIRWENDSTEFRVNDEPIVTHTGPYSLPCDIEGPLCVVGSVGELESAEVRDGLLLLHGEITAEQLMPKNFPFYNPESHRRIIALIEEKSPAAIVAATGRNPDLAGAWYPFPLFEDGDFDIPNAYIKDVDGAPLVAELGPEGSGGTARLAIRSRRVPSTCEQVIARRGGRVGSQNGTGRRVALTAHIDSKEGSPGAADNGGGVVVLLLLLDLLAEIAVPPAIEIVPFNGEDYYACPGQIRWVEQNRDKFGELVLGLNLDGVGTRDGQTAFSLYECGDLAESVRSAFAPYAGIVEGAQWYQSDHSIFMQYGVPAVAVTTSEFAKFAGEVAHTADDVPEVMDPEKLAEAALAIRDLIGSLSHVESWPIV